MAHVIGIIMIILGVVVGGISSTFGQQDPTADRWFNLVILCLWLLLIGAFMVVIE